MQLASRLRHTTLGDLLATLHRAGASGVLELIEPHARHAIHLRRGHVQAVESDASASRLGDVATRIGGVPRPVVERARLFAHARGIRIGQALVAARALSPAALDELLAAQQRERLEGLYALTDAEVRFRVARSLPAGASERCPLTARETYYGRPRARARASSEARTTHHRAVPTNPTSVSSTRARALAVLGLGPSASDAEARAVYRSWVLALHPDRCQALDEAERNARVRRLAAVVEAYRALTDARG